MRFVTINKNKYPPCLYLIGEEKHDLEAYMAFIINAVVSGWMARGYSVVVDNAIVHSDDSADILSDFLWNAPGLDGHRIHGIQTYHLDPRHVLLR